MKLWPLWSEGWPSTMTVSETILVKKRSSWEQYLRNKEAFGDIDDASLQRIQESHLRHLQTVSLVEETLASLGITPWVVEGAEKRFDASPGYSVLAVGGDGTFLSASHNIGSETGIMGINSDPEFSRGRFCTVLTPETAKDVLKKALCRKKPKKTYIPRMAVLVDGHKVASRILNEALFSHTCPAAMTRVVHGTTRYACSGLWVGTGAGSTGAIKSAGGKVLPLRSPLIQMVVREPCGMEQVGCISLCKRKVVLRSKTQDGTLYFDGPFRRAPVRFDQTMEFVNSCEPLMILGPVPE